MPKSIAIQKQVDQVKIWLSQGLTTEEIRKEFAKKYEKLRLADRTIDNRIKQAKKQAQPIIDKRTEEVDSKILEREKKVQKRLREAHINIKEILAGGVEDFVSLVKEEAKSGNKLAVFEALKRAKQSGLDVEKWQSMLRLENNLPNSISQNENTNKNFTYEDLIKALDDDDK